MQRIMNILSIIEIWFFYGLLITFTLSIRKVLFFYPIQGQFNEYTGIYLYLSDIFVLLILASWLLSILYNKIALKSMYSLLPFPDIKQKIILLPLLLVVLSFSSVMWSGNNSIAIFRSLKLLELYLFYLWIIFGMIPILQQCSTWNNPDRQESNLSLGNVPRGTILFKKVFDIIIIIGIVQSVIGVWQFVIQKSIGLIWLKESIISSDIAGVAKVVFNGEKYIRAYGLFPHPNILGGFLILSILMTIMYFKMFHVEHFRKATFKKYVYYVVLGIQALAIILTFSKSAWIGLMVVLTCLWYQNVPRGTFVLSFKKIVLGKMRYFALIAGILLLLIVTIKPNWYSMFGKSIEDRMFYFNVSRETFLENPILGVGVGQFVLNMESIKDVQGWQFQPVHSIFLLILNELGIIGFALFLWFVWETVKNVPSQYNCSTWNNLRDKRGTICIYLKALLFGFLFIMLVDHYFWDIQQGQMMLWLVLGLIAGGKVWTNKNFDT